MGRKGLYTLLWAFCALGFLYLSLIRCYGHLFETAGLHACFFKNVTGYPCVSCGTTRAVHLLYAGRIYQALLMNPIGIIVGTLLLALPVLLLFDLITGRNTVFIGYAKIERALATQRWLVILLILLVIVNWIWNINKNL